MRLDAPVEDDRTNRRCPVPSDCSVTLLSKRRDDEFAQSIVGPNSTTRKMAPGNGYLYIHNLPIYKYIYGCRGTI
jgi:hypothetical protein